MMLVLVLVAVALVAGKPSAPGCCTPPQWQGLMAGIVGRVTDGVASATNDVIYISYDKTNGKIAYDTQIFGSGPTQHTKIIYDYTRKMQFIIDLNRKQCTATSLTTPFVSNCLPDDAKPSGKFYYGIGSNTFPGVAFSLFVENTNVTVTMTPEDCIPMSEITVSATQGNALMQSVGYVNLTPGIKDPSVFIPPGYCTQGKPLGLYSQVNRTGPFSFKLV